LPVPLLPSAMTFSRLRMYSPRESSRTSILLSEGMAAAPMIEAAIQKTVPSLIEDALRPIYGELHAIREDLNDLRHRVKDMAGYRKVIDYAFERIAAIEKHLGIERKQVA